MATPLPICYLNGSFEPLADARISPLDRGFLFADGVYEVLPVFAGRPFRFKEHFDRLDRSLNEIRLPSPHTHPEWQALLDELVARNGGGDMYVYIQVTRGMEYGRNHAFPAKIVPTVFGMASPLPVLTDAIREQGLKAITVEDFRWGRCDIKSIALLANVLIKQSAEDAGANEAIIVSDGNVLEGASTSVFAVIDGVLKTPPNSHHLLPGTTRDVVLELAKDAFNCQVEPISLADLRRAEEIWIAAATRDVLPVTM
ncbi:MAG: aminotransferase class IV, partial [Steroidobacteraceae bacterium]